MTPEALAIITRRLVHPQAADQLAHVHRALVARSPILGQRYARLLEDSGALSNPETTAEERSILMDALPEVLDEKSEVIRLRLSPRERAIIQARAEAAGKSISALVRDELCQ